MPEKKGECPHLNLNRFSGGMRAEVCEVLGKMTGAPAFLGPERLFHYCRGEYGQCLFPGVAQREAQLRPEISSDEGGDRNGCVDFTILEKVQKSYSSKQLRTRLLRIVYKYAGLPQSGMSEENGLWMYRVIDEHMLRLYRDVISRKKVGCSGKAHLQEILTRFPGLGVMTFRLLEDYLFERGMIWMSYFSGRRHT